MVAEEESLDTCFFEWIGVDGLVKLAILSIRAVD
jgi:hypothetical protein